MIKFALLFMTTLTATAMPPVPRVLFPDPPAADADAADAKSLAERIAKNSRSVSEDLADAKTEAKTLRDQQQVTTDLDALIKMLDKPPPPTASSQSSGGGSSKSPPRASAQNSASAPEAESKPMGNAKAANSTSPQPTKAGPSKPASGSGENGVARSLPVLPREESLARDFWGHLPDAPRQQMMQFYREQYLTRYKDLLADYYRSLAEKDKK